MGSAVGKKGDCKMESDIELLSQYCLQKFDLDQLQLSNEYYYHSFPFAMMDAVFSIGVRYSSTRSTVIKYCNYFDLKRIRDAAEFPAAGHQHCTSDFIANINSVGNFAETVLKNKQRTSSKNGILKADATFLWAKIFQKHHIETLQCFHQKYTSEVERELKTIKGQHSGLSVTYLKMLCGDDNHCKPDRHIIRFVSGCLHRNVTAEEASSLIERTCDLLKERNPSCSVRLLDHTIWKDMSEKR